MLAKRICRRKAYFKNTNSRRERRLFVVPKAGLEPAHPKAPPPQDGVSTNSTTPAVDCLCVTIDRIYDIQLNTVDQVFYDLFFTFTKSNDIILTLTA